MLLARGFIIVHLDGNLHGNTCIWAQRRYTMGLSIPTTSLVVSLAIHRQLGLVKMLIGGGLLTQLCLTQLAIHSYHLDLIPSYL